ncbi:hypothetical protein DJ013_09085 [Arcticibacterium luteifluviistationis]|uniref:Uncharacterized protein n=2 Tax=Arcticibacterium luteifluviistationis TaxID=1784714 RepID=A0A2Z4GB73_9BACT|nr:hypothetical protein DJ013_09085 [Arcticibacterium luteifluviistationis]
MNDKEIVSYAGEAVLLSVEKIPRGFKLIENSTRANALFVRQSEELEPSNEDEKEELLEEEGIHIPNSFYISALIIIIIAGYLMNKRKPLLNQ